MHRNEKLSLRQIDVTFPLTHPSHPAHLFTPRPLDIYAIIEPQLHKTYRVMPTALTSVIPPTQALDPLGKKPGVASLPLALTSLAAWSAEGRGYVQGVGTSL